MRSALEVVDDEVDAVPATGSRPWLLLGLGVGATGEHGEQEPDADLQTGGRLLERRVAGIVGHSAGRGVGDAPVAGAGRLDDPTGPGYGSRFAHPETTCAYRSGSAKCKACAASGSDT